jgi:predicted dehydrogenase
MKKTIRLGIIGTGGMAHSHAGSYQRMSDVKVVACCDISQERARAFAQKFNIPGNYTDYKKMLDTEQLDAISNVTIDSMHAPISIAALKKGIAVLCEKPMATSLADAKKMYKAAEKSGATNMVNFSYRNASGLQAAARFIAAKNIGRIIHVEASYLQSWLVQPAWGDWHNKPAWMWRLSTRHGSAGDLGDIGCHIYDLTTLLCGDIETIYCRLKTFDKGVKGNRIGEYLFDANDSFVSNVVFANGAIGTIHSSRWASGHQNSLRCRVYGDKGAVEVDLDSGYDQFKAVQGKEGLKKAEWKIIKAKPTPNNYQRFITSIKTGKNDVSDFANGCKIQAYLENSFKSNALQKPVKIKL